MVKIVVVVVVTVLSWLLFSVVKIVVVVAFAAIVLSRVFLSVVKVVEMLEGRKKNYKLKSTKNTQGHYCVVVFQAHIIFVITLWCCYCV